MSQKGLSRGWRPYGNVITCVAGNAITLTEGNAVACAAGNGSATANAGGGNAIASVAVMLLP